MKKHRPIQPKTYRISIYTRVSTEEQAENPEGSIRTQELRLREYVKLKNLVEPFGEVTAVYSDPGISAKDMNRPGFQKMLSAIEKRETDLVMVTELSRFSRSTKDFTQLQEFLEEHGCKFLSLRENFDTSGAAGSMVLNMMASIAEFERRQTGERVAHSFLSRAKRGLYNGGSVPLGFKIDELRAGYLVVDNESVEFVRLAFRSFVKYGTLAETAKFLNSTGAKPPKRVYGGGSVRANGFTIDSLYRLLKNKSYIGVRVYNTKAGVEEAPAVWDAIIDRDLFDRVGVQLKKNRNHKRTHDGRRYPYTLSGITFCGVCGERMCGKSSTGGSGKVGYYEHIKVTLLQSSRRERIAKHDPHRVPSEKVEPIAWQETKRFVLSDEYANDLLKRARLMQETRNQDDEALKLRARVKHLGKQIEAFAERIGALAHEMDASPLFDELKRLQKAKIDAEAGLVELERNQPLSDEPVGFESLHIFRKGLKKLIEKGEKDKMTQTAIIRKVVHKISILPNGIEIHFHVGNNHYLRELGQVPGSRPFFVSASLAEGESAVSKKNIGKNRQTRSVGSASLLLNGDPGGSCTPDLQFRKPLLYLSELRGHDLTVIFEEILKSILFRCHCST
jgi:site-specific DNA recombinase